MELTTEKLKELLVNQGLITREQLEEAKKIADGRKRPLAKILVENGFIAEEHLGRVIAEDLGILFINLQKESISAEVLRIIPPLVAKTQKVIAFREDKEGVSVAMADPGNLEMIQWLKKKTGKNIIPYFTTPGSISKALNAYRGGFKEEFEGLMKGEIKRAQKGTRYEDAPVIRIVDAMLDYAYQNRASDIHIEPREDKIIVRYRIDGLLHDIIYLPRDLKDLIITRIKVLSRLRTDEHYAAQDGKFRKKIDDDTFDIRVSIVPIVDGEKIVMRILSSHAQSLDLENLGFEGEDLKRIQRAIQKSFGMILSTGPTGSGKTTTLYAILKILNTPDVNISTIEDPVEYAVGRVNQIQVNQKTGLTFAKGLRSIVRQDPDIIMVGEIRDEETADIAVNSAMTGHLVLSTLHTNDAATTFPRLMDMGVKPFLVASSINVIVGQRLVRRVCQKCIESYVISVTKLSSHLSDEMMKFFGSKKEVRLYRGKGCKICGFSGYSGRVGIYEVLEIQDNIKELVMKQANANEITAQALKNGMTTMLEDGIRKTLRGMTSLEEVMRVA